MEEDCNEIIFKLKSPSNILESNFNSLFNILNDIKNLQSGDYDIHNRIIDKMIATLHTMKIMKVER